MGAPEGPRVLGIHPPGAACYGPRGAKDATGYETVLTLTLGNLMAGGVADWVPDLAGVGDVPLWRLPAMAACLQYWIALCYVACHEEGPMSRPDFGDQVDFRHAAYAGLADLFVSGDVRMRWILMARVVNWRAEVLTPDEFVARISAA